jgi:hypothetical protein
MALNHKIKADVKILERKDLKYYRQTFKIQKYVAGRVTRMEQK